MRFDIIAHPVMAMVHNVDDDDDDDDLCATIENEPSISINHAAFVVINLQLIRLPKNIKLNKGAHVCGIIINVYSIIIIMIISNNNE